MPKGRDVVKDGQGAVKWFLLAGAKGAANARKAMACLEVLFTAKDRRDGQKRARAWQAEFNLESSGDSCKGACASAFAGGTCGGQ